MKLPTIETVFGVDFSGAALAGRNIWIARAAPASRGRQLRLVALDCLERLAESPERTTALLHLVGRIRDSDRALWAMDFPFGLPIEVVDRASTWRDQLEMVHQWPDGANALGLRCVERARKLGDKMHIRRTTDGETRTPFDCYHYRIIYQTFHGMRDVLRPLAGAPGTAILPFEYARIGRARRVVLEACPGSTLKRLGLPHQNYKQPAGGPLQASRLRTRRAILEGLASQIELAEKWRQIIMRNPGGDALDAVIAAAGAWQQWTVLDHRAIKAHVRYPLEGFVYA